MIDNPAGEPAFRFWFRKVAFLELQTWTAGDWRTRAEQREKYLRFCNLESGNWCACFLSFVAEQARQAAGIPLSLPRTPGARKWGADARALGWANIVPEDVQKSDVLIFWRTAPSHWHGHIGIVLDVQDGTVYTIEGNSRGAVRKRKYRKSAITNLLHIVRPPG